MDNSSTFYSDNGKNKFLILSEVPTFGINGSFGSPEKILMLVLVKQTKIFV